MVQPQGDCLWVCIQIGNKMKQPHDDKFIITKAPAGDPWKWIVWLPVGQRWLQNGSHIVDAHGAGVNSFWAGRDLVAHRLSVLERLAHDVDALLRGIA